MPTLFQLSLLAGIIGGTYAAFGWSFATGPTASGNFITEAASTLIVPEGNTPFQGFASLWCGMGTDNGDLVQTILDRHPGQGGTICEDVTAVNQWCAYTYTLTPSQQIFGPQLAVQAGDHLEYRYVYNDSTGDYDQFAVLNGNTLSTLSTPSGHADGWGTAIECAATDCGTVPAHQWINTVIHLQSADPSYGNTVVLNGVTSSGFSTSDSGATWTVDSINVPAFTFS